MGTPNQLYGCINDCYDIKVVLDRYKYKSKLINDYSEIKPTKATILDELKITQNSIYGDIYFYILVVTEIELETIIKMKSIKKMKLLYVMIKHLLEMMNYRIY